MTIDLTQYADFVDELRKIGSSDDSSTSDYDRYRNASLEALGNEVKFPAYRYTSFVNLNLPDFSLGSIKIDPEVRLDVSSPDGITISRDFSDIPSDVLVKYSESPSRDTTDILHDAFCNSVVVVKIPDDWSGDTIKIDISSKETVFSSIFVVAGKNSSSKVTLKVKPNSDFMSCRIFSIAKEDSKVDINTVLSPSEETILLSKSYAYTLNNSSVKLSGLCIDGKYMKSDYFSLLNGDSSSSDIMLLSLSSKKNMHNFHTESRHMANGTSSQIFSNTVVSGRAKSLCTGNVYIDENAFSSNGYETQKTLLLSSTAEGDAIPNLEIHNHDVKCSHGSTIGRIDEEKLFYLMSRGLPRREAERVIVLGFFMPLLEVIGDNELISIVEGYVEKSIFDETYSGAKGV